jgi:hypothetical protein
MLEQRKAERYSCSRSVDVDFFTANRYSGRLTGEVRDISVGGLLLRFDTPPPVCSHLTLRTRGHVLRYVIRHRFERDGSFFTGVQVVPEVDE